MDCSCNHPAAVVSACQTLDEMEFDRGPWSAALYGDVDKLSHLLNKGTFTADSLDSSGYSALHYAARAGHIEIVRYLHSVGANINLPTRSGQ